MKRSVLGIVGLALCAPAAWSSDSLTFFNNWFVTGDYAVAGVGLHGTGNTSTGLATGTIDMTGVPSNSLPIAAFLYWSTVEPSSTPGGSIGYFDGNKIQGAVLGNPNSPNPGCTAKSFAFVYRADVLRYLPVDSNNNPIANGNQTVKLPDVGANPGGTGINTNGASLVVIYKVIVAGLPTIAPLRAVVIYNGAFTLTDGQGAPPMTQAVAGFYQAAANDNARVTSIVANGQKGFTSPFSVNGQTLSTDPFVGTLGAHWDNPSFNVNLPTNAASFTTMATAGNSQTCVTWAAIVSSMNVQDSDNDGLLDIWETQGLHRNTTAFPATFGTCSNLPAGDTCVNLPAMGANPNKKDIFVQIDWMHATTPPSGSGGTDGLGTHDHMPQLQAMSTVASVFSTNGINLHFDVGPNYFEIPGNAQAEQSLCGNAGCSFIVPAAYASGGSDIDESTLICQSTQTHPCDYPGLNYPVLSFEYGFASVRDGNQILGIPAHFAQNRKDIFHYALFAHALAGPFNAAGTPINPFTLQATNAPLSYSGIAHKPGGGFMVTLGLWRSDIPAYDQVGSVQVQAGTLMHELGHNLGLGHAGLSNTPNCMPNYPSVMNYMYQTRGLTDAPGNEHVDYSYGTLLPMSEDFLDSAIPMALLPGLQRYRVRYYAPLAPNQPSTQAAQVHCDGTPLPAGAPAEVRLEGPAVSTPDWSNGNTPLGHILPPLDVNYDGTTGQLFADQPDWLTLNLQQVGTGYSFGGLSVGGTATASGAYATDGGAFATDAGALATDAGAFATDGGAFATDAGAFATDGGAFATDGGALATDGGAFATDAGEIDEITVLLSTVDSPPTPTAKATINSIQLMWSPPSVGNIESYNLYRCAVISPATTCTPAVFKNLVVASQPTGFAAAPNFTDTVNDVSDSGEGGNATCSTSTCYNTTYIYAVTSLVMGTTSPIESLLSKTVSSEVTHLFIASTVGTSGSASVVYGAPIPAAGYLVLGDVASSLTAPVSCAYSPANPRNVGTYYVVCTTNPLETQTSPTDGITYLAGNATYLSHAQGVLTITAMPITVTAAASKKVYDGGITAAPGAVPTITSGALAYTDTPNFTETYDNPNVQAGATHTMTPAGTVIDGNGDGDGANNYKITFVPTNNGIITPAPLTATITGSQTYGGTHIVYAAAYSGLVPTDSPSVVMGTLTGCTTNAVAGSPVGNTYTITGCSGLSAANYTISYSYGAFTVNPAPLVASITGSQTYGGTGALFTPGYSGLVNNDPSSVVTGTLACTTNAAPGSPVTGSYSVTSCTGLISPNYTISYSYGRFTVNPAPLVITVAGSQYYGGASTMFMPSSYATFVNGDSAASLGGTLTCTVTPGLNAGSYQSGALTACGGLTDSNYIISFPAGTFIVNPAPQSISFGPLTSQPLTTPDFQVTATASSGLPVTFTATGSCSIINGNTVHLMAAGSCTITAAQSGGGNYLGATSVNQTFTITDAFVISDFTTLTPVGSASGIPVATKSSLTMTTQTGQTSAAWYPIKQTVGNGFTTQFTFQISSTGGQIADGFAFVIQNAGLSALGTTGMGGYLGYQGLTNSLAIEFDTYQNDWDPSANHMAIQSNGTGANSASHSSVSDNLPVPPVSVVTNPLITTLANGATHTVVITYDGMSTLTATLDGTDVVTASVSLSTLGLDPGGNAVIGFTAATGASSEKTQILSWSFTANN